MLALASLVLASLLRPENLRINRVPAGAAEPGVIDVRNLTIGWDLRCAGASNSCVGVRQAMYRVLLVDELTGVVALDTGGQLGDLPGHTAAVESLRSSRRYSLEVRVRTAAGEWLGAAGAVHTALLGTFYI